MYKALEMGICLHRGPLGNLEGDSERQMKESSGNGASLSVGAL